MSKSKQEKIIPVAVIREIKKRYSSQPRMSTGFITHINEAIEDTFSQVVVAAATILKQRKQKTMTIEHFQEACILLGVSYETFTGKASTKRATRKKKKSPLPPANQEELVQDEF